MSHTAAHHQFILSDNYSENESGTLIAELDEDISKTSGICDNGGIEAESSAHDDDISINEDSTESTSQDDSSVMRELSNDIHMIAGPNAPRPRSTNSNLLAHSPALVWVPIPLISFVLPFVGHVGITNSKGTIHDFSGPYTITENDMLFGDPVKYLPLLSPNATRAEKKQLDKDILHMATKFRTDQNYNFVLNNCHHFVGRIIYGSNATWLRQFQTMWRIFWHGKYVGDPLRGRLRVWLPFGVLSAACVAITLFLLVLMIVLISIQHK